MLFIILFIDLIIKFIENVEIFNITELIMYDTRIKNVELAELYE